MANTTKSNRLKRKRGKKFVFRQPEEEDKKGNKVETNPFETHSRSRNHTKDLEKRQQLLDEYRRLGKNSSVVDHRIAEKSSKLSEDDKMKLRYIAEQKNSAQSYLKHSRKREKFNLDSDESDGNDIFLGNGFTHKGKPLIQDDDFDERISMSSEDERADKGQLNEEMVNEMNFGQGNEDGEERRKSRKEVFEEIIEKSKAYRDANKELKTINHELVKELDDGYMDLIGKLNFTRKKNDAPAESTDPKIKAADEKGKGFDSVQMMLKYDTKRAAPVQTILSEHDQAALKKRKIEETLNAEKKAKTNDSDQEEVDTGRKRDQKRKDKREMAIEKALMEQARTGKDIRRSAGAGDAVANKVKQVAFDNDLLSEEDNNSSEDEASEMGDDESGEFDDDEEFGESEDDSNE